MAKRETPEVNSGSLADIAFLLLIYWLLTTTMDVDTGIARQLPPIPEKSDITEVDINKEYFYRTNKLRKCSKGKWKRKKNRRTTGVDKGICEIKSRRPFYA